MALAPSVAFEGRNPLKPLKILALTRYGRAGASSRLRFLQYLPWLREAAIDVSVQPLLGDAPLQARYRTGRYGTVPLLTAYLKRCHALLGRHQFDVVWIEKEALPWAPLWLERGLLRGVPYVLDFDDAVFHNYDKHRSLLVRRVYGRRLDRLMARAALVVDGNSYLAQRARDAGAPRVELLPTVIDLDRYPEPAHASESVTVGGTLRIVWIGSPTTVHYLQLLREPLQALARTHAFVLRVVGGGKVDLPGVNVEEVPWSEATEVASIGACDVGVMPLLDSPWERGKCGYKLIQYMACGLPVVASDVGANSEIVQHDVSGLVVRSSSDWEVALQRLLSDAALRARMGQAGRRRVEQRYCVQHTAPLLANWLRQAAEGG